MCGRENHALRIVHLAVALLAGSLALFASAPPARAVEAVRVSPDVQAIDLTPAIERYRSDGDEIRISTAPGRDGIVRRIAVKARETGTRPDWIVFALTNDTDEQLDRLLVAPHFRLVGSGVIWPDLGGSRIAAITASQGIRPEREDSTEADVFLMTLDPGTTVTFVAELNSPNVPQIYLWDTDSYRKKTTGLTLYKGIIIGIAGLLALFLTIVFVVKGALIFPAAAALAWAVLAYACIDFGFFQRVFPVTEAAERIYRAAAEAVLAATLLVFLFAYLNLNRWHVRYGHVTFFWLIFLAALVGLAVVDPPVASGVARISIAAVAGVGFLLVVHLATHGYDRAVMLVPTWVLLVAWVAAGAFTVTGSLASDLVQPALIGALVLIVMLIGFTVMQHAFAGGVLAQGLMSDTERRALALAGAGDIVFDWDVTGDKVFVGPEVEQQLGLKRGALEGSAAGWLELLHPFDVDRYRTSLDAVIEERRGRVVQDFRLRAASGPYHWFRLKARPMVGTDGEVIRIVGTIADVTEGKTAEERLLHDAVHDSLTGLPNRELFNDRLDAALTLAAQDEGIRPTVLCLDLDRFKQVNDFGRPQGVVRGARAHDDVDARPFRDRRRDCDSLCVSPPRRPRDAAADPGREGFRHTQFVQLSRRHDWRYLRRNCFRACRVPRRAGHARPFGIRRRGALLTAADRIEARPPYVAAGRLVRPIRNGSVDPFPRADLTEACVAKADLMFSGSFPSLDDRYLGPLIFEPYAEDLAQRMLALNRSARTGDGRRYRHRHAGAGRGLPAHVRSSRPI